MPILRVIAIAIPASLLFAQSKAPEKSDGGSLFEKNCAVCHRADSPTRAPHPDSLARMTKPAIQAALETGSMKAQGAGLTGAQRLAVAAFLSKTSGAESEVTQKGMCPDGSHTDSERNQWNGWGVDLANTRYQPPAAAGLRPGQIPDLKLKWAFGFPGATVAFGQPTVFQGRLLFGSANGTVYSLDARSGCTYWTFKAPVTVRTAISVDPAREMAFFGDTQANVYAIATDSGRQLWKTRVDTHPFARITGAPALYGGRLYVPVSSVEEAPAGKVDYACCTFRGSVAALEAQSGKQIWKTYAIPDPAAPTRKNAAGAQLSGPAGAAIWSAPTIDVKRKAVYVATGNAYSNPMTEFTDAVLALDLDNGNLRWARQMTPGDGWNFSCQSPNKANCPETSGGDHDFGSSPILRELPGGKSVLIAAQKSGAVYGLDPDERGKTLWETRIGRGGALGGIEWGAAADLDNVYAPLSDWTPGKPAEGGGLFALKLATGEKLWDTPAPKPPCLGTPGCSAAQMAPATAIAGIVFSGSMDGHLRAYDTRGGKIVWDLDTVRDFDTVNGVKARGGSLNGTGPTVVDGMLYVNSGYGALGGMPGNVLLAFGP
ncbi:MAG: PQQ-binding-like beta-propeller repeat protein [Acidobacteriota bacterium]|nr:PQQ-binding-like beta-propeller repeat protein [Acidobacteriota bacterium]